MHSKRLLAALAFTAFFTLTLPISGQEMTPAAPGISVQQATNESIAEGSVAGSLNEIAWNPDSQSLAAASSQGLSILSVDLQQLARVNPNRVVNSVSWSPSGNQLAATNHSTIEVWNWDTDSLSLAQTLQTTNMPILVSWSPDGSYLVSLEISQSEFTFSSSGIFLSTINVWNTTTWTLERVMDSQYIISLDYSTADLLDWNPNGGPEIVLVGHRGGLENGTIFSESALTAFFINVETGQTTREIRLLGPYALSVAWHPFNNIIAVGDQTGEGIYSISNGDFVNTFELSIDTQALDWSPDGRYLLGDNAVGDLANGTRIGWFDTLGLLQSAQWHPNGTWVALGNLDGTIQIFDVTTIPGFVPPPTSTAAPND